ncbi:MAG: DNA-binding domain-containing protein [Parabacteroides sp.]|nr:DNA-binding domain-containing protein [Parabacteroides sp.]
MDEKVKNYSWTYDLEEYTMTKDVAEDYTAKVQARPTLSLADIARLVAEERTEYRPDTLVNTADIMEEMIRRMICQGYAVQTNTALYTPCITGVLMGTKGLFDPAKNACVVNLSPTQALRQEVTKKVTPVFSGHVRSMGGARIALVKDVTTGKTDGTITPGGLLDVTGSKIRCLAADGVSVGSLTLVNTSTQAVAATITTLGLNDPSRLMFNIPANLADGSYLLRIETYFTSGVSLLKSVRTIEYPRPLVVGGGSESPDEI